MNLEFFCNTPSQESTLATDWAFVSSGEGWDSHMCAIKTDGSLWCWGRNDGGRLGNGEPSPESPIPVECFNPDRPEGALLYNSSSNVMQYCDGGGWVGIGK